LTRYRPTPEADRDLEALADYYTVRVNIVLGLRFLRSAEETFKFLAEHPGAGWRCRWMSAGLKGTRVFPVRGFRKLLVFYRADAERLLIVRVLHGARDS
jgi:toxin ParE1/3/4